MSTETDKKIRNILRWTNVKMVLLIVQYWLMLMVGILVVVLFDSVYTHSKLFIFLACMANGFFIFRMLSNSLNKQRIKAMEAVKKVINNTPV